MRYKLAGFLMLTLITACVSRGPSFVVVKVDRQTGFLALNNGQQGKLEPIIEKSQKFELTDFKEFVFVTGSNMASKNYLRDQLAELKVFDQIMDYEGLEKIVVANKLQDEIPSLKNKLSINKLYTSYKPFLWIHLGYEKQGNDAFMILDVTDPRDMDVKFKVKVPLHKVESSDANVRYPLINALIGWLKENNAYPS